MTNIFDTCTTIVQNFIPTLANLLDWFFNSTLNSILADFTEGLPPPFSVPEWVYNAIDFVGIGRVPIYGLLVGGALVGVLIWNLIRWIIGIITGS